jgi:LacI family transcriptional regulator
VTIRDVAKRAGVTLTTVSSALGGRGRVSDDTRDAIRKIADELGYQPKLAAQMMRAHSTGHIGLILPGQNLEQISESGHAGPILANFVTLCEQRDVAYHIEYIDHTGTTRFKPPRQIVNGLCDGVVLGGYVGPELCEWLDKRNTTWISVGEPAPWCVISADDDGVYQAAQRLAALGHRHIAYAGNMPKYLTQRLGLEGFRRAQAEFGLHTGTADSVICMEIPHGDGRRKVIVESMKWAERMLACDAVPTAVICHDMTIARAIIYQALRMGKEVPRDLSVMTVGLPSDAEKSPPAISTIEVDFNALVAQAMDMLLQRLDGRLLVHETRNIAPKIVMRDTVSARNRP